MDHAKVAHRIREKIAEFSGKVSEGLPKTARRMVQEVLYGVQSRGSVRLSEMAVKLEILVQHIHRAAKRIYGIPEFRYYALADGIKQIVSWKSGTGLSQFTGKPLRLRVALKDADLYSFQFATQQ